MTRVMVRRRSEPVEAVQWHKPGDHPAVEQTAQGRAEGYWMIIDDETDIGWKVVPGVWIISAGDDRSLRVLTPEQFAEEYERVE